ncbi:MAG: hypothetical protein ACI85F_002460 [Bacteroidia bacterium]|jgi:hypothetical protein
MPSAQELKSIWSDFSKAENGVFDFDEQVFPGGDKYKCSVSFNFTGFTVVFVAFRSRTATMGPLHRKDVTKVFVPLNSNSKFQLDITPENFGHQLLKMVGVTELELGNSELDPKYFIRTNEKELTREILTDSTVEKLLLDMFPLQLRTKNKRGLTETELPVNTKLLLFESDEVLTDRSFLKNLLVLFKALGTGLKKNTITQHQLSK